MSNMQIINKLKDCAELAWASYGYFHFADENYKPASNKDDKRLKYFRETIKQVEYDIRPTFADILNIEYKYYKDENGKSKDSWYDDKFLGGDFSPTQAKQFFEKYELLIHQPNTESGFSATLFQHKQSKLFTLAIRGTDEYWKDIKKANIDLIGSKVPLLQYNDMLLFYVQCKGEIPFYVDSESKPKDEKSLEYSLWKKIYIQSSGHKYKPYINQKLLKESNKPPTQSNFISPIASHTKLTITGHSLGGALAQLFALSFANDKESSIIKEVYTYNAPGARDLKLPYDMIIYVSNNRIKDDIKRDLLPFYRKQLQDKTKELKINAFDLNTKIDFVLNKIIYDENNAHTYFGISISSSNGNPSIGLEYAKIAYEKIPNNLLQPYQTLIHNYNNRNKEGYKLSISDRVFHIETKDQVSKKHHSKESYSDNATQHLGKDIDGNYFILNLNFGGFDSHTIVAITQVLYFYLYLYEANKDLIDAQSKDIKLEYEPHKELFLTNHLEIDTAKYRDCKKVLEYCNRIAHSIHKILYNNAINEVKKVATNDRYDTTTADLAIPNWLYVTIDRILFEASIKTHQKKFELQSKDKDMVAIPQNLIEAIFYLQNNEIYIQLLNNDEIKNITKDSALSLLFSIHELRFFISIDKNKNPLIDSKDTANHLFRYNKPLTNIFCREHKANDMLIECLKDATLDFYPKAVNE